MRSRNVSGFHWQHGHETAALFSAPATIPVVYASEVTCHWKPTYGCRITGRQVTS